MQYQQIKRGRFIARPNRFMATVEMDGQVETVHVKNTGRCRELLLPSAKVILAKADNPQRKTRYDLVAVEKASLGLVNIDSQVPNKIVQEWLANQDFDYVKPEYRFGDSRLDFYMEKRGKKYLLEVKGCTLEREGIGYFPDAPTERGVKHIHELIAARKQGYWSGIVFVIQMPKVREVQPNLETQPSFGEALALARQAGVKVFFLGCKVTEDALVLDEERVQAEW